MLCVSLSVCTQGAASNSQHLLEYHASYMTCYTNISRKLGFAWQRQTHYIVFNLTLFIFLVGGGADFILCQKNYFFFHFDHISFRSSSILVILHLGCLPFGSSSIQVVFRFGRLPFSDTRNLEWKERTDK